MICSFSSPSLTVTGRLSPLQASTKNPDLSSAWTKISWEFCSGSAKERASTWCFVFRDGNITIQYILCIVYIYIVYISASISMFFLRNLQKLKKKKRRSLKKSHSYKLLKYQDSPRRTRKATLDLLHWRIGAPLIWKGDLLNHHNWLALRDPEWGKFHPRFPSHI